MSWAGKAILTLWCQQSGSVMAQLPFRPACASDGMLAEDDSPVVRFQGKDPQIEQLVMQGAQGKTIVLGVWSTTRMPLNVRCFQSGRLVSNPQVEAANTATVLIGAQQTTMICSA